jgi:hypothetical protein
MNLYRYRHSQQYSCQAGLSMDRSREDLGVLGNELKTVIPDAVTEGVS